MVTVQNFFITMFMSIGLFILGRFLLVDTAQPFSNSWIAQLSLGLIFSLLGAGFLTFNYHQQKAIRSIQALKARYPEQPWRWRDDWQHGYANSVNTSTSYLFFFMGMMFILVSAPFLPKVLNELMRGNWHVSFALFFPVIGIALLTISARERIRLWRFGRVRFYFDSPVSLGSHLTGKICYRGHSSSAHIAQLELNCYRKSQRSYSRSNRDNKVIWESGSTATAQTNSDGACFPVNIPIPYDLPATGTHDQEEYISWYLKIKSNTPGVNFGESFYIPVHSTDKSNPTLTQAELRHRANDTGETPFQSFSSFTCHQNDSGLIIQTRRGMAAPAGLVFIGTAVFFAGFALVFAHDSLFFTLVFSAASLLMITLGTPEFFRKATLLLGHNALSTRTSGLLSSAHTYHYPDIHSVDIVSKVMAFNKRWYDLQLKVNISGISKKVTIPCRLQKTEIDWLAAQLENRLVSCKAENRTD